MFKIVPSLLILLLSILSLPTTLTNASLLYTAKKAVTDEYRNEFDHSYVLLCEEMLKAGWSQSFVDSIAPSAADRKLDAINYAARTRARELSTGKPSSDNGEELERIKRFAWGVLLRSGDAMREKPITALIPLGGLYLTYLGISLSIYIIKSIISLMFSLVFLLFNGVGFGVALMIGIFIGAMLVKNF